MFCKRCHYSLRGLVSCVCPECGRSFDPRSRRSFTRWPRVRSLGRRTLLLMLVLLAYTISYAALVKRGSPYTSGGSRIHATADYELVGRYAIPAFAPAHFIDRKLRQGYWAPALRILPPESPGVCYHEALPPSL